MNSDLRLAVIGADRRGLLSLEAHRPGRGARLVAACSMTPERLGIYRERCGDDIRITRDYREIVDASDIDGVFVCTPDHLHEEHALAVLAAGKHLFLEKPMAITIEGCDRILNAAAQSPGRLYVGHNMRFFAVMRKMRDLIESGVIGEVQAVWCRHFVGYGGDAYFKDWHSERRFTTGLLLQKGAHDIDMIHWLAGASTVRVMGLGKLSVYNKLPRRHPDAPVPPVSFDRQNWPPRVTSGYSPVIDVEDHSMLLMELANGVQASYQQCHYTPDGHRNYTIIGTEGRIENYGDESTPELWASVHLWNHRTAYSEHGHQVFRIPPTEGTHGGSDPLMIDDFLRFICTGEREGATPLDARMAVATGVLGTASIRGNNQPFQINPPEATPRMA